jgi:hypothetical protein
MGIIVLDNKVNSSTEWEYGDYAVSSWSFMRVVPVEEKTWIHRNGGPWKKTVMGYKKIDVVKENIEKVLSL